MKSFQIFFAAPGDCGCHSSYPAPCTSTDPASSGSTFDSARYLTLGTAASGQVLVVPKEGTAIRFLRPGATSSLIVMDPDGTAAADETPVVMLPLLNPAVSSAYPAGIVTPHLLVAGGDGSWKFLHAPTNGQWSLQTTGGYFVLVDATQIPGINAIGSSVTYATKGDILTIIPNGPGQFLARKLSVIHGRVIVGDIDGDGITGYTPLSNAVALRHPIGNFVRTQLYQLEFCESDGTPSVIPTGYTFGGGAQTDLVLCVYSPALKRILAAPQRTYADFPVYGNSGTVTIPVSYAVMPGGRCQLPTATYNYPTVLLTARVLFGVDDDNGQANSVRFAFYCDGVQIYEIGGGKFGETTVSYIATVTPGNHTFDLRWKRQSGTDTTAKIQATNITAITLF